MCGYVCLCEDQFGFRTQVRISFRFDPVKVAAGGETVCLKLQSEAVRRLRDEV